MYGLARRSAETAQSVYVIRFDMEFPHQSNSQTPKRGGSLQVGYVLELLIGTREFKDLRVQGELASPSPAFRGLVDLPEFCNQGNLKLKRSESGFLLSSSETKSKSESESSPKSSECGFESESGFGFAPHWF